MARLANGFLKLEMLLLKIISVDDCYGYQLVQDLAMLTDDFLHLKEGTMYPILYRLLGDGYISDYKVLVGKRLTRVYYRITPKGLEYLQQLEQEYRKSIMKINNVLEWNGQQNEASNEKMSK
ncbi:MAG: PadR family transcriptional regulator [Erysipelotrichaceae bacterium]|nr:PadR family transcriptional regulator [Erysipelotrichaceae bacterium]